MFNFKDEINLLLQGLIAVILIGMFYSLWKTTHAYGGLIGHAIRMVGIGIILISVVVLERMLINFNVVEASVKLNAAQDVLTLLSLLFLSMGFKKFAEIGKTP